MNSKRTSGKVIIGTRGSPLALAQANEVKEKIINLNQDPPTLLIILNSKDIYIPVIGFIFFIILTYLLRKKFYKK